MRSHAAGTAALSLLGGSRSCWQGLAQCSYSKKSAQPGIMSKASLSHRLPTWYPLKTTKCGWRTGAAVGRSALFIH
eukprot:scaffold195074_cov32-Tisochrysis_lutea.AAC.5